MEILLAQMWSIMSVSLSPGLVFTLTEEPPKTKLAHPRTIIVKSHTRQEASGLGSWKTHLPKASSFSTRKLPTRTLLSHHLRIPGPAKTSHLYFSGRMTRQHSPSLSSPKTTQYAWRDLSTAWWTAENHEMVLNLLVVRGRVLSVRFRGFAQCTPNTTNRGQHVQAICSRRTNWRALQVR